jgi:hypothetical protein
MSLTYYSVVLSTYSTSPNFVSISAVIGKDKSYTELVERTELPLLKQYRWHKFALSFTVSKYYKLVFFENYGDEHHIAVRQIRFLRSIESKTMAQIIPNLSCVHSGAQLSAYFSPFLTIRVCNDRETTVAIHNGGGAHSGRNRPTDPAVRGGGLADPHLPVVQGECLLTSPHAIFCFSVHLTRIAPEFTGKHSHPWSHKVRVEADPLMPHVR